MLDMSRTRVFRSIERPVVAGQTIADEGLALRYLPSSGVASVQTADTTANTVFAGLSYGVRMTPATAIMVATYTVPASSAYTVTLSQPLIAGSLMVKTAAGTVLTAVTGAPSAGEVQYAGGSALLTFNAAQASVTFTATWRYSLTVQQAQQLVGDPQASSNTPSTALGTIGVIQIGDVYTTEFDSSVDWGANNVVDIRLAAAGRLTIGGSGVVVYPAVKVLAIPTADYPFLGLGITVA